MTLAVVAGLGRLCHGDCNGYDCGMRASHIRLAAAVFMSAIGVWWFAYDVMWADVWLVTQSAKLSWIALAALALLGEFLVRAYRWRVLLGPLGNRVRLLDLWSASVIGAAVNTLIPLRAGEVAKPMVAARRTGHRLTTLFATNVMERVFDLLFSSGIGGFFIPDDKQKWVVREMRLAAQKKTGLDISQL